MRFHLLSLAHLPQSRTYLSCAFTQKNRKMAKMLTSLGHEVFFYGSEGSDVEEYCNSDKLHFIETHKLEDIRKDYGDGDNRFEIGYDWTNTDFRHDFNSTTKPSTYKFQANAIQHILKNKKEDDFLLLSQGYYYKNVKNTVQLDLNCEFGIGYRGSDPTNYRAFESSYLMNFTYGSEHPKECINGSFYDRVIPNYFDTEDIEFSDKKEDYYLFIGRMIRRKGILTAYKTCEALKKKLIIVGQGAKVIDGNLVDDEPHEFTLPKGYWEYQGFADIEKRKKLMAHAIATFTPTEYLESFGGTHVESMLSGTPVLTTNFGVYPNTFKDGEGGYHCDTLDDFIYYAKEVKKLDPHNVKKQAEKYLMNNVRWQFQKWFDDLYCLYESKKTGKSIGWNRIRKEKPSWRRFIKLTY